MSVYKDEKRGTWFFTTRVTTPLGEVKQVKKRGFPTKKEAVEAERLFLTTQNYKDKVTLAEVFDFYLKDKANDLKTSTLYNKKKFFENHILKELGNFDIHELTPLILKRWQNNFLSKNFKNGSLKDARNKFSSVLNYCVNFYALKENPFLKIPVPKNKKELQNKEEYIVWNIEDFNKAMAVLISETEKTALALAFWTGIRKGELLALTWEDFDEENEILTISKNKQRFKNIGFVVGTPKSNFSRIIDLPKNICKLLKNYKKQKFKGNAKENLFPFNRNLLLNAIKKSVELAGVPRIRVHDLRHSHASVLIAHNFPIAYISKRLGHSKISITLDTYTHFLERETGEIKKKLDEF